MLNYLLPRLAVTLATVIVMEPLVALTHRYVMHGFGWAWHRDHHQPGHQRFERNDLYALVGAALSVGIFAIAGNADHWLFWVALGMTVYGVLYALLHDGLVHRRYPLGRVPENSYLRRLIEAHHLHHAVREREGAVSFGFLYAPPVDRLRGELSGKRSRGVEAEAAIRPDRPRA
jgi:beta-carotene 3-hydroxylase